MNSFFNVGIGKYSDNYMALQEAQELSNEKAEIFKIVYAGCVYEGLIASVHAGNNYFKMQMLDGTQTDRLDIEKLESIEKISRWNFDFSKNNSFKIYVDDLRPVPEGYIGTKSVYETISLIEYIEGNGGTIEFLDLDHDLGDFAWLGGDAIKLLDYLVMEEKFYPIKFHTANPVGRANMEISIYDLEEEIHKLIVEKLGFEPKDYKEIEPKEGWHEDDSKTNPFDVLSIFELEFMRDMNFWRD